MEVDNDLRTTLGTETLADRGMVPPSFDYTSDSSADTLSIEIFEQRRSLRVERSIKKLITPKRKTLADDVWVSEGVVGDQGLTRGVT
jgi:hypothetical protein